MGGWISSSSGPTEPEPEESLPTICTADNAAVKTRLDEAVAAAFVEMDYDEDTWYTDIKLTIMFMACAVAAFGQFYPLPFPENRLLLGVCAVLFFGLNMFLTFWIFVVEKGAVLLLKPKLTTYRTRVFSNFPRFQDVYTLTIQLDTKLDNKVEQGWSVGEWFDKEGHFDEKGFITAVRKVIGKLEKQKVE